MVERGPASKARLDRENGQLQRNNPEVVQVERTPEDFEQNPFEISLKGEALEQALEGKAYAVGQRVELLNALGIPEKHTVIGVEEANQSIFLAKTGDTSPAPSLEILTPTELAVEEAVQPFAIATAEHWDNAIQRLVNAPYSNLSLEDAQAYFAENKGKILRAAALSAFEKSIDQTRELDETLLEAELQNAISFFVRRKLLERLDTNPRHREAENLRATSEYYQAIGNEHAEGDEPTLSTPVTDLIRSKIDLLKFSAEPEITAINPKLWSPLHEGEVFDTSQSDVLPSYAVLKVRSKEAWTHLRSVAKSAEKYLTLEDPSSPKILEIYKVLEAAHADACRLDSALHQARLREHPKENVEISDTEYHYWEKYLKSLEEKPIIAAEKRAKAIRQQEKQRAQAVPQKPPKPVAQKQANQPVVKRSWLGKQLDRFFGWM